MNNDVFELIDMLYDTVNDAWTVPLGAEKCVIPRQTVLDLITEIKNQIPKELDNAKKLINARDEFITKTKAEAEGIRKTAEDYARTTASKSAIVQNAQAQAESILTEANAKATDIISSAEHRAEDLKSAANACVEDALKRAEETLNSALSDVSKTHSKFQSLSASIF